MRLSEMKSDAAFEVMSKLTPYVAELSGDSEMHELKAEATGKTGNTRGEIVADIMSLMLTKKKNCLFGILAVLKGTTPEEMEKLPFSECLKLVDEGDIEDLLSFFPFLFRLARAV